MGESDAARFAEIFHRDYAALVRMARLLSDPADAEDVVQTAFLQVFSRGRLRDPELVSAYLRRTVLNLTRTRWRRRVTALKYSWIHPRMLDALEVDHASRFAVQQALTALPRRQREALVLRYYANLSVAEASDVMGVSIGSVKAYTSRGLAALGDMLAEEE